MPALLGALVVLAAPASAGAATITVNNTAPGNADNPTCITGAHPCTTISYAVTNSPNSGDVVDVAAGTYSETQILISHPLTLQGAGAGSTFINGVVPGVPSATPGLIRIAPSGASNPIKVDGFTIRGAGKVSNDGIGQPYLIYGFGVPAGDPLTISDNVIDGSTDPNRGADYINGLYDNGSDAALTLFNNTFTSLFEAFFREDFRGTTNAHNNTFTNEIRSNAGPGNGGDRYPETVFLLAETPTSSTQTIANNTFTGNVGQPIGITALSGNLSNVNVLSNVINANGAAAAVGGDSHDADGIRLNGRNGFTLTGVTIDGNIVSMGSPSEADVLVTGATSGVVANDNDIVGAPTAGFVNNTTSNIDATMNWWGCNTGPNTAGCTTVNDANTGVTTYIPFETRAAGGGGGGGGAGGGGSSTPGSSGGGSTPPGSTPTVTQIVQVGPRLICARVPDVIGHSLTYVRLVLHRDGCDHVNVTSRHRRLTRVHRHHSNRVVSQSPDAGTTLYEGQGLSLVLK